MSTMLSRDIISRYYLKESRSVNEISKLLNCSESQVNYWLSKHKIKKRGISDAVYLKKNPLGHPFKEPKKIGVKDQILYGLGLGLFWGEGYKKSKASVRLGNTDPHLIKAFILFLKSIFKIEASKLRFGIQIFQDLDKEDVKKYWVKELSINTKQVYPTIVVSKSLKKGTYKAKNKYGVITVYFNNTRLKKILDQHIEKMKKID